MEARLMESLQAVSETLSVWGLRALGALALLVVGVVVARLGRRGIRKAFTRTAVDEALVGVLAAVFYYVTLTVVAISVVGAFGVETASLITILGTTSLAIGLALQGSLSNMAAGVMLLIQRPYRVGEFVRLGENEGTVAEIGLFATALDRLDSVRVVVPNASFSDQSIVNYSANGMRRNDIVIGISDAEDLGRALGLVREVVGSEPRVLPEPAPVVAVGEMGDGEARLFVRPWCRPEQYWGVRFDLTERIAEALQRAGCSFSCPQREIRVVPAPASRAA